MPSGAVEKVTDKQIEEALIDSYGNVTQCAKICGIGRIWMTERIRKSENLQSIRDDAREQIIDIAEDNCFASVRREAEEGKTGTANSRWLLQTLGKKRGYSERTEITGEDGGAIEVTMIRKVVGGES